MYQGLCSSKKGDYLFFFTKPKCGIGKGNERNAENKGWNASNGMGMQGVGMGMQIMWVGIQKILGISMVMQEMMNSKSGEKSK